MRVSTIVGVGAWSLLAGIGHVGPMSDEIAIILLIAYRRTRAPAAVPATT